MSGRLISSSKLASELADVVVMDCRFSLANAAAGGSQFETGHIPGACHLDMEQDLAGVKTGQIGRHPLPQRQTFEARLRAVGVNASTPIVLYDDNRFAGAARAWWLLRYWGHDNVRILDGGLNSWLADGRDVAVGAELPVAAGDVVLFDGIPDALVDLATMKRCVEEQSRVVVDARERIRFLGEQEPIDPVAGRIPGACNAPWLEVTDADGFAFDAASQRARWRSVTSSRNPILYCGSGVTACVNLLSRELAGLPVGSLYNGGWSEWCGLVDVQIARGASVDRRSGIPAAIASRDNEVR